MGKDITFHDVILTGLIDDRTMIWIRQELAGKLRTVAAGNWFHDDVLGYIDKTIQGIEWAPGTAVITVAS